MKAAWLDVLMYSLIAVFGVALGYVLAEVARWIW